MKVKQDILDAAPETAMDESYRLFLDLSSTCSGYVVARMEGRKCIIVRAGAMWFPSDCPNGQKYYQMQQAIGEFYTVNAITDIIYESYHVNPNQVGNSLVVPEMIGAVKAACYDIFGMPISIEDMSPTAWRGQLGIKADKTPKLDKDGKPVFRKSRSGRMMEVVERDYKTPTINYVDKELDNQIPKQIRSNITGNLRSTPNDLYDAFGVCMGWHKKFGVSEFILAEGAIDGAV
jgi:hypothetical protein